MLAVAAEAEAVVEMILQAEMAVTEAEEWAEEDSVEPALLFITQHQELQILVVEAAVAEPLVEVHKTELLAAAEWLSLDTHLLTLLQLERGLSDQQIQYQFLVLKLQLLLKVLVM